MQGKFVLGHKLLYFIQNKSDVIHELPFAMLISTPSLSALPALALGHNCKMQSRKVLPWDTGLTQAQQCGLMRTV